MALTTAKKYLLVTERIADKPVLRTRFTTQAYLVLATILDLLDHHVLAVADDQFVIADPVKFKQLPPYLDRLKDRLQHDLQQDPQSANVLKVVTSWNIVNDIYDGIGVELEQAEAVERVIFQNNLKPHTIYEPTDDSRRAVTSELEDQLTQGKLTAANRNLWLLLQQQGALTYLFDDQRALALSTAFTRQTQSDPATANAQRLVQVAGKVIQMKKFAMDRWLS